jgi:chromosome partitioning protein
MAIIIGVVSQKGGVGKSTITRMLAREYAAAGWQVKIADMDISQSTSFNWNSRRLQNEIEPTISVEQFGQVQRALNNAENYDLMVFDGAPSSNIHTLDIAKNSDIVVIPTGTALDDLEPTIKLAHELKKKKVAREKIVIVLSRVGSSSSELDEAIDYIKLAGYKLIDGQIPEQTAFRRASDMGLAITETSYESLNKKADVVAQGIIDYLQSLLDKK